MVLCGDTNALFFTVKDCNIIVNIIMVCITDFSHFRQIFISILHDIDNKAKGIFVGYYAGKSLFYFCP